MKGGQRADRPGEGRKREMGEKMEEEGRREEERDGREDGRGREKGGREEEGKEEREKRVEKVRGERCGERRDEYVHTTLPGLQSKTTSIYNSET